METGAFWQVAGVDRRTSVDRQLLRDLARFEADLLESGLSRVSAQKLIGRVIFAQYLVDRRIVRPAVLLKQTGSGTLPDALSSERSANRLFRWLARTFSGDVFVDDQVSSAPAAVHWARAARFLTAEGESGQIALFPYRFDIIPVELTSSIYEQFAHAGDESEDAAKRDAKRVGVHYTPLALVSLILET